MLPCKLFKGKWEKYFKTKTVFAALPLSPRKTRPWLRRNMSCHSRLHMPEPAPKKKKFIRPLHPWHPVTHHWLTFPSDIATKMLQCIWQKSRHWTRPWKGLMIPAKMAISPATKWHQCKEGCLGCSWGDWFWTAVLANLNTIDWTHIDCQPLINKHPLIFKSLQILCH